jgi:hypothetical protein
MSLPLGAVKQFEGARIIFNFDGVQKIVPLAKLPFGEYLEERLIFLKEMYEHAIGHRGLVQVSSTPRATRSHYTVTFSTKGIRRQPRNEEELREMARDILTGLKRLHDGNFLHHDIRTPNIVYDPKQGQYVLIDFEHGAKSSNKTWSLPLLKGWDEKTLVNSVYTNKSEIYQLGKVLDDMGCELSEQGRMFVGQLKNEKITANAALDHVFLK